MTLVHGGVNHRVAWLLASSRVYAEDAALSHRDKFVQALNARGVPADQARVSRWETGNLWVPDRVVTAYEQVLGLVPGHLAATVHGLRRSLDPLSPGTETTAADPDLLHQELDQLFEHALGRGHSSDWLALTHYLAVHPTVYLRPETWTDLSDRLVSELSRATGGAFTRRYEALRTLIRHDAAQRHVLRSIGRFVTDPEAQSVVLPLTLLQEVTHPRAAELVMRLLSTSSGALQEGAAWVAASKLARGHFDDETERRLEGFAVLMIAAMPRAHRDVDIFDVAARLPEDRRARVTAAIRETRAFAKFDTLVRQGEVVASGLARDAAVQVAHVAQKLTPPPYHIEPDGMLQRLVREAMFHGHQERRHQAAVLLTTSRYRAGVAAGLAAQVQSGDPEVARPACGVLRYLATEVQRPQLLSWAGDPAREEIQDYALMALGRLPQGLQPAEQQTMLDLIEDAEQEPVQLAAVGALGMCGSPHLRRLADGGDSPAAQAAAWWLRMGPGMHESLRPSAPNLKRARATRLNAASE
ncbi:hypothetical protein [Nocardioides mesophilus]|uniref:Uncharacterized protein n=1 Tax=Nocardioides mesophilus TaxID=433659 RepID=A0A7G9R7X7_9ACTN|nr:hypothetical protein [Nocardioides mesophilus]QNN51702.1 hypothetical protein H9L09_14180 [Nocardioides mesophilus]